MFTFQRLCQRAAQGSESRPGKQEESYLTFNHLHLQDYFQAPDWLSMFGFSGIKVCVSLLVVLFDDHMLTESWNCVISERDDEEGKEPKMRNIYQLSWFLAQCWELYEQTCSSQKLLSSCPVVCFPRQRNRAYEQVQVQEQTDVLIVPLKCFFFSFQMFDADESLVLMWWF